MDVEAEKSCRDCHTRTTPLWRAGPDGPRVNNQNCSITRTIFFLDFNFDVNLGVSSLFVMHVGYDSERGGGLLWDWTMEEQRSAGRGFEQNRLEGNSS